MKVVIKKYGRWDESCNWQLESETIKELSEEEYKSLDFLGYTYTERLNEYHLKSGNKLIVVHEKKGAQK